MRKDTEFENKIPNLKRQLRERCNGVCLFSTNSQACNKFVFVALEPYIDTYTNTEIFCSAWLSGYPQGIWGKRRAKNLRVRVRVDKARKNAAYREILTIRVRVREEALWLHEHCWWSLPGHYKLGGQLGVHGQCLQVGAQLHTTHWTSAFLGK